MENLEVCGWNKSHAICEKSNITNHRDPCVYPSLKPDIKVSNILSYSTNCYKSVYISKDHIAYGIGDNKRSMISGSLPKEIIDHFSKIELRDTENQPCSAISAVCGYNYTLYMICDAKNDKKHLAYAHSDLNSPYPVILNIGTASPVSLFGGDKNCAAIDEEGAILYINEDLFKTTDKLIKQVFLPDNEKAVSVACCNDFIISLSSSGKVFMSSVSKVLSFKIVEELKGIEISVISGISSHCIVVSKNGSVFTYGENYNGQFGLGDKITDVEKFTEIQSLRSCKIVSAYAGECHSLFQTSEGKLFACGANLYGALPVSRGFCDKIFVPEETTSTNVSFCVAGYSATAIFTNYEPPMSPNKKITTFSIKKPSKSTEKSSTESRIKELEEKLAKKDKEIEDQKMKYEKELAQQKKQHEKEIQNLKSKTRPSNPKIEILDGETVSNLERICKISSGGFGKVYKVAKKVIYALKVLKKNFGHEEIQRFLQEYEIMNMLFHPNILKTYGIFLSDSSSPPSILLEFCPTNLEESIKNRTLSSIDIVFIIYQIVEGMKYVHFRKIIHRDLKPSNILIGSDGTIKICDFGISKIMSAEEQSMTCGIGTQKFMAPEIIDESNDYNEKVDVYSFGVLVFFILSGGNLPTQKMSDKMKGKKASIPADFTEFARKMIDKCWNFKSDERPSFDELLNDMKKNDYKLINLSDSERDEVKQKIEEHKSKIPQY